MLYSLTFASLLCTIPAQGGELKISNVRLTVGELGPNRQNSKLIPGDILFISYDINGLNIEPDGVAKYRMSMEVTDAAGKSIFKQDPRELNEFVPLRGNTIPARAFVTIGLDQDPGNYVCKVTVEDPKTKSKDTLATKFEVVKREFAIVAVYTTADLKGEVSAPSTGTVGQTIFMHFSIATFMRDPKTKQPNVSIEFQVYDEKGQAILGKPGLQPVDSGIEEKEGAFAMRFPLFMSRPGKFTAKVTANDKVAKKSVSYELPVVVLPPK